MKKIVYKNIDEVVYETTLKNKMKVYLLYKKDKKRRKGKYGRNGTCNQII